MQVIFQTEYAGAVCVSAQAGENLLALARRADVAIDAPCAGGSTCGKCRVRLLAGELGSLPSRHITEADYEDGWRLACCSRVVGDCKVFVPDAANAFRRGIKTDALGELEKVCQQLLTAGISLENPFRAVVLKLQPGQSMAKKLQETLGAEKAEVPDELMEKCPSGEVCVKGAWEGKTFRCMAVCPPEDRQLVGCAIDIGTTTVSAVLADLTTGVILAKTSAGNEQIRYGADVIHRIIAQARPGGKAVLQDAIIQKTLIPMLEELRREAGVEQTGILRLAVGANTTMNHLLLGVDADPIRKEPYTPAFLEREGVTAGALGLPCNPYAEVLLAPNIGSYVGGDITAGMLPAGLWQEEGISLFLDLGTNGELVLGNRDFLLACACSAGPAFEGGELSCGMRATRGAVEAVTLNGDTLEPRLQVIGGGKPAGICGSGIIDLVAQLFAHKVIDPRGKFIREGERILRDGHGVGRYVLAFPQESSTGAEVSVTEVDMDNFIRAKAAIYAGIDTLLQSVDMTPDCVEKILVAGGIGSGINIPNAISIGMLPKLRREKYQYIGNSSLAGAYAMAISPAAAEKCRQISQNMTYLELSTHPGYMDSFVAACFLPHTRAELFQ